MRFATILASSFDKLSEPDRLSVLSGWLEALVTVDRIELRAYALPPLYESGVAYVTHAIDRADTWQDVLDTYHRRSGVCEDLAAWRIAELRERGDEPTARAKFTRFRDPSTGSVEYHVTVLRGDGSEEDPSLLLGMTGTL